MLYAVRSMHVLTGGLFPAIKEEKDGMSLAETLRSPLALTAKGITRFTQSLQEYEGEKNHRAPSTGKDKNRKPTAFRTMGRQSEEEADRRKFPRDFEGLMNERKGGKVIRKAKKVEEIEEDEDNDFDLNDFMSDDRDRATSRSPPSTPPRKRGGRATESNDSLLSDSSSRIDSRDSRATTSSSSSFRDSLSGLSKRNSVVNSVKGAGKEEPAAGRGRKGILPRPSRPAPRTIKAQDDDDDE